jgi:glucan biosynthesis protein
MRAPRIGYIACVLIVGASAATAQEKSDTGIDFPSGYVEKLAADMATRPFATPANVADEWAKLIYDQYRDIRFRGERAVWRGQGRNFELHLLPSAWLYKQPITINIVENGRARPIQPDNAFFEFGSLAGPPPEGRVIGFSGFRINGPINRQVNRRARNFRSSGRSGSRPPLAMRGASSFTPYSTVLRRPVPTRSMLPEALPRSSTLMSSYSLDGRECRLASLR